MFGVSPWRTGSCTHAFNPDQRYVSLKFTHEGSDILTVTAPPGRNIGPCWHVRLLQTNIKGCR
ncbi:galactose oxidase-like domain-containing protein [Streptomyces sp. NPDC049099]|uniref:galactose oxidase-like domain-containing protein n=1 Tax=Streptomyces sp. NPDC049099 TaxID=3155768 RepID=UPI00343539BA